MNKTPTTINVLDYGHVTLYDWMGNDLRIVNMARQSFGKESKKIGDSEVGLINFLLKNRHGTPLEGVVFTFNVKCPIFVSRQWFRHRIGSFNEYSGRYSKMIEEFYVPEKKQIRTQIGKVGHYKFKPLQDKFKVHSSLKYIKRVQGMAWEVYEYLIEDGVAKEIARTVLPTSIYTQFTWVVNLRSLFNFISLRSAENAMWEIQQYSKAIEKLIEPIVPVTYQAFNEHERIAP